MLWYHKTDSYQWINGSIRVDLEPDERSVWADLMALAGLTREGRRGHIERSEGIPYPKAVLLTMLNIKEELFDRAVEKCIQEGRLQELPDGTLFLSNWVKYNDTKSLEDRKAAKKLAAEKARQNRQSLINATLTMTRVINETNKRLAEVRYIPKEDGTILDTKTGEIKTIEEIKAVNNG